MHQTWFFPDTRQLKACNLHSGLQCIVHSLRFSSIRTSQCELYIDVDCRSLQDLFESQKHEYYSRRGWASVDDFVIRNASIPHTLAGTYLSKIDPLRMTSKQIRWISIIFLAVLRVTSYIFRHYFCTDVVDALTMFREPAPEDQEQVLAWREKYSSVARIPRAHSALVLLTLNFYQN